MEESRTAGREHHTRMKTHLEVMGRVPRGVKDHHTVRAEQVDAQRASLGLRGSENGM